MRCGAAAFLFDRKLLVSYQIKRLERPPILPYGNGDGGSESGILRRRRCAALQKIYYGGSAQQWNAIDFEFGIPDGAAVYYNHYLPTDHTAGAAVRENVVPATCTTAGGYDEVVYCTVCPAELSRTHVTVNATGHDWGEWEVITPATTQSEGLLRRVCRNDSSHVQEEIIPRYEEDEEGSPAAAIVEWFNRVMEGVRGFIDWLLRLFHNP